MADGNRIIQKIAMAAILIGGLLLIAKILAQYNMEKAGMAGELTNDSTLAKTMEEKDSEESTKTEEFAGVKIVVDAGHGGDDPGKVSASGKKEKNINLDIALLLKERLLSVGFDVVMTREKDQGLYDGDSTHKKAEDLKQRLAIIESPGTVFAVSIHQNSYPEAYVRGPQVFYYTGSKSGEQAASVIQNTLNEKLSVERPRVHKANNSYYILKKTSVPTVIAECGFLSNPEEASLLADKDYQKEVVEALFEGITAYMREWMKQREVLLFIS